MPDRPRDADPPATPPAGAVPEPPRGVGRLKELGPGFLWMVSAAGSGELLFTPRIAAQYGYALLWALLAACALKWFINREVGRYAVCTGASVLDGFSTLPGPKNWAVWAVVVPQLVVAVAAIAGLASSAATALVLVLPGDVRLWMVASVLASTALVLYGRYAGVERAAQVLAVALAVATLAAAAAVFPDPAAFAAGLVPRVPTGVDYGDVLPWLGYMLAGAAGMMWYSYWLNAKGYGAAARRASGAPPVDPHALGPADRGRLRGWITQMTLDNTVAVVGGLVVTVGFLVLGAELLRPRGLVPDQNRVAETLGLLLGGVFGPIGFWFMVVGVFVGFWDTVLSDQDGHGRLHPNGASILLRGLGAKGRWTDEGFLRTVVVLGLVTAAPIGLYLAVGEPVRLLRLSGAIEAAHIPVVAGLVLVLNRRALPPDLRPSRLAFAATALAGAFFAAFAALYLLNLTGVIAL